MRGKRFALSAIGAAVFAFVAPAQSFKVSPEVLTNGGEAQLEYSDPSSAGQTILIEIDNQGFPRKWDYVLITLNGHGDGSATWLVPESWNFANFLPPSGSSILVPIAPPPPPQQTAP